MTIEDAYAIRDRSAAWKAGKSGPWKTDEGEMIKKTCVKQAYKYWPKTERLETAIHHLNENNGEGLAVVQEEKGIYGKVATSSGMDTAKEELDNLTPERKAIVEAVCNNVVDLFNADDFIGCYEEYIGITVNEERAVLYYLLPKEIRKALQAHDKKMKQG
jgi:hypothetical protein